MALGARKAFEEMGDQHRDRWLSLPFLGCDGMPATGQAWVRQGLLAATVVIPPNAGVAVEMLAKALNAASKASGEIDLWFKQYEQQQRAVEAALGTKLPALLDSSLVEEDGCVFLEQLRTRVPTVKLADFKNRTAFECYVNHIHVEDYSENGGFLPLPMLGYGMAVAQELRDRLAKEKAGRHFHVIVNFDGDHCDVRFHTVRPDEEWLAPDLEEYPQEALAVLDTTPMRDQI